MIAICLCKNGKKSSFEVIISYKNEPTFKYFEGIFIGKCTNCGLLKTFPPESGAKFNPKQSRGKFYDENEEKFTELFQPVVNLIKKYKPTGNILDVGCSSGILLSLLQKEGFKIKGIEPNRLAYQKAGKKLGKNVFQGTLPDFIKNNKTKFDCIIYNHVLEHIADPLKEIKLAKKILKKDGVFIIGVPNTRNIIFYLRQKYWEPLMPNEHIWHFNDKYLIKLFEKNNFYLKDKSFFDDKRCDYSLHKRLYFKILSFLNKIFLTGEAVLLTFQLKN